MFRSGGGQTGFDREAVPGRGPDTSEQGAGPRTSALGECALMWRESPRYRRSARFRTLRTPGRGRRESGKTIRRSANRLRTRPPRIRRRTERRWVGPQSRNSRGFHGFDDRPRVGQTTGSRFAPLPHRDARATERNEALRSRHGMDCMGSSSLSHPLPTVSPPAAGAKRNAAVEPAQRHRRQPT